MSIPIITKGRAVNKKFLVYSSGKSVFSSKREYFPKNNATINSDIYMHR